MKKIIQKLLSLNVIRFLIVGGFSTFVDFVCYMLLSLKLPITLSKAISMGVSSVLSYVLNKQWTFSNKERTNAAYLVKYYITFAVNVATNLGINFLMYEATGNKVVAFVIATGCAMTINFVLQKLFVFRKAS